MTERQIGESRDTGKNGHTLTRTQATPNGHVVRITVFRPYDEIAGQGVTPIADASIFQHAEGRWLNIASLSNRDWYEGTEDPVSNDEINEQLDGAAATLYQQARDILSYDPRPPTRPHPEPVLRSVHVAELGIVAAYHRSEDATDAADYLNTQLPHAHAQPGTVVLLDADYAALHNVVKALLATTGNDDGRAATDEVEVYVQDSDGDTVANLLAYVERHLALKVCMTLNERNLLRPGLTAHYVSRTD